MENPSLPEEILVEIFSRLPQKSIGKSKCLSKFWLSFISTPKFIKLWLTINDPISLSHTGKQLILITQSHSLHLVTPTIDKNDAVSRKLEFPGTWTQVIGSCKGLVLLTNKEGELFMVNPVSSLMVKIPDFDLALEKTKTTIITHGFGYDDSSNDYKIVTISCNYVWNSERRVYTFVDVYSVKKGVWKRLDNSPFVRFIYIPFNQEVVSGVFVSGAIHWQVCGKWSRHSSIVATFDLANEVFYDTGSPDFLNAIYKSLVVRGGRLCAVSSYYRLGGGDVWTMEERGMVESWKKFTVPANANKDWPEVKLLSFVGEEEAVLTTKEEYGSVESWKKFSIPKNEDWPEVKPVCFVGEEGVVLRAEDGRLFVFDMKEGTMNAFVVDGVPASCTDMGICNFVDSLI